MAVEAEEQGVGQVREVMTSADVGLYLSFSESTIHKMVQHKEMPFVRIGSRLRFPKALIDQWLADRSVQPTRSLLDEFEMLYEKFHLKKFLQAKGIKYQDLTDEQLIEHLRIAIRDLRAYENAEQERPELGSMD